MTSETAQQADDLQDADETPRQRVRIRYAKEERIKFISHQDEFRAWERALRRAGLPLLYKQGFNPQPHIQFASPLGVGFTGLREPVDITFAPPVPLPELSERLAASLPPGLTVRDLAEVPLKTPALQSQLIGADYAIRLFAEADEAIDGEPVAAAIERRIAALLRETEIWRERERKGKRCRYNLRPLILELAYQGYDEAEEEHRIFLLRVQRRQRPGGLTKWSPRSGWTATRAHCAANVSTSPTMRTTRRSSPLSSRGQSGHRRASRETIRPPQRKKRRAVKAARSPSEPETSSSSALKRHIAMFRLRCHCRRLEPV